MSGLLGAIRLAAMDVRGISLFDPSPLAAWRSLALLVPLLLLSAVADMATLPDGVDAAPFLLMSAVVSVMQMTGYLLAVSRILDATGREDRFPLFVSTYLWCSVISSTAGIAALAVSLNSPEAVGNGVTLGLVLWSIYYSWFSVRTALGCPGAVAAGLLFLEILTILATNALPLQLVMAAQN